jgi:hypothetical protein
MGCQMHVNDLNMIIYIITIHMRYLHNYYSHAYI